MMKEKKVEEQQLINFAVSEQGSLGLLALGSLGLKIWRDKKKQVAEQQLNVAKQKNGNSKK